MAARDEYSEDFAAQISFHAFSIGGGFRTDGGATGWRSLPASLIEMPSGGSWELWLEGAKLPLAIEDGDALVVPAGVRHMLRARCAGRMETRFVLGSFLWISQLDIVSKAAIPRRIAREDAGTLMRTMDEMRELWESRRHSIAGAARLHKLAFKALETLLAFVGEAPFSFADSKLMRLSGALSAMNARPEAAHSCIALARKAGLSPSRFNAAFREALGVSPKAYLGSLRIKKASSLLISSDRSVYEIAGECGFKSSCYFCRFFMKSVGMAPSAFREEFRSKRS